MNQGDHPEHKPKMRRLYVGSSSQRSFLLFCFVQIVLTAVLLMVFSMRSAEDPTVVVIASAAGLFAYFMVMLVFGLVFSNRVFGPLYRFEKHLRACAEEGEIRPIQFRKGDVGHDLTDAFNDLAHRLKKETERS